MPTNQSTPAGTRMHEFKIGQLVIVDSMFNGEIIGDGIGDGSFYRVEVDADRPNHEFWTVRADRMEPF